MTNITMVNGGSQGHINANGATATKLDAFFVFDGRLLRPSADAVRLASCDRFETIVVNTRRSVYEIVVLNGRTGDILVRGGSKLPEFRPAVFAGSTADGRALKVNTIDIGLRMELHLGDDGTLITSSVAAVSRAAQPEGQVSVS